MVDHPIDATGTVEKWDNGLLVKLAGWLADAGERHLRCRRWQGGWTLARAAGMLAWSVLWALLATILAVMAAVIGSNGVSVRAPSFSQRLLGGLGVVIAGACLAVGPGTIWCYTRSAVFGAITACAVLAGALLGLGFLILPD